MQALGAAVLGGEAIDVDRDLGDHRLEQLAAHRDAAVALGQRHDADRDRDPGVDLRMRRAIAGRARSGRAAPAPRSRRRCRTGSRRPPPDRPAACSRWRQAAPRSRGRRSPARCRPRCGCVRGNRAPLPAARQASVAISRARVTPRLSHLGAADPQRVDRAQDRRLAQQAGAGDAFAEPDDARERVDHAEAVAGGARHQQPAVVGAEIERGIGRAGQSCPPVPAVRRHRARGCRYGDRRPRRGPWGSRSGTGPRPVARASSSIENLSPRRSSEPQASARRRGGDLALRGKV